MEKIPPSPHPAPVCAFGECAEPAPYGFSPPAGSAIARFTTTVFTCALHREHGNALLQAKIDAETRNRAVDIGSKAARERGLLL